MKTSTGIVKHLLTGSLFLVLFACKKGMVESKADSLAGEQAKTVKALGVPDVYVAGSQAGAAVFWKNGIPTSLLQGIQATGIAVVGANVYVSGYGQSATTGAYTALYWVNGSLTTLTDGSNGVDGMATGIGVKSNGDVYVAGYTGRYSQTPVYWVNGVLVDNLKNADGTITAGGIPGAVCVTANDDVYLANRNANTPQYWKNGVLVTSLAAPLSSPYCHVQAVKEIGGIVYAVGSYGPGTWQKPLKWVGNSFSELEFSDAYTEARDITIDGNGQPFIVGVGGPDGATERTITWGPDGAPNYWGVSGSIVTAYPRVVYNGGSVYVCGADRIGTHSRAMYWVGNGFSVTTLNSGPSVEANATDIVVQ
jgi:hypothetical protein